MLYRIIVLILCTGLCLTSLPGCSKSDEPADSNTEQVKTLEQHREDAAKEINEENMEEELQKLEQAIDQEASAQ